MEIKINKAIIRPVVETQDELGRLLEIYRECEDFLALGPVAKASLEMVKADLEHSRSEGGLYCSIVDPASGEMVGVVDFVPRGFQGKDSLASLSLLMIAARERGKGLGEAVARAVEAEITKDRRISAIDAGVQVNNPKAIRFWQRMGYQIISEPRTMPDGTVCFQLLKKISRHGLGD